MTPTHSLSSVFFLAVLFPVALTYEKAHYVNVKFDKNTINKYTIKLAIGFCMGNAIK